MLTIRIPGTELFNEEKFEFFQTPEQILTMEHSLISLSKWESKWNKPFLTNETKTIEESKDYFKCMLINSNVKDDIFEYIDNTTFTKIREYIDAPMTATTFSRHNEEKSKEIITSELIYYMMVAYNIPFECQKWHLNRLMTLIRICDIKNSQPKKQGKNETYNRNKALNNARRKANNTRG